MQRRQAKKRSKTGEEAIEALGQAGADHGAADTDGRRPLHKAVQRDQSAGCCRLVEGGAAPSDAARDGSQPLHSAAEYSQGGKVVEELVSVGAEVGARRADGRRPVELAGGWQKTARETLEMAGAESI